MLTELLKVLESFGTVKFPENKDGKETREETREETTNRNLAEEIANSLRNYLYTKEKHITEYPWLYYKEYKSDRKQDKRIYKIKADWPIFTGHKFPLGETI